MLVKMKEILVVEGKNDTNVLKSFLDCDTIETNGTHLGKEILRQIRLAQKTRGVIIFTDPDFPGEKYVPASMRQYPAVKMPSLIRQRPKQAKRLVWSMPARKIFWRH